MFVRLWNILLATLKKYPAVSAALVNIAILVAARFGLHLDAAQVVMLGGVLAAIVGAFVHTQVTPVAKLKEQQVKAGENCQCKQ